MEIVGIVLRNGKGIEMKKTSIDFATRALDAFNKGFVTKSAKQSALDDTGTAYNVVRSKVMNARLDTRPVGEMQMTEEVSAVYWAMPHNLFGYRPSRMAGRILGVLPESTNLVAELLDLYNLRESIKGAPIVPVAKTIDQREVLVHSTIAERMNNYHQRFVESVELSQIFCGLNVVARPHWVVNEHGTRFIRTFFYLHGKLASLNMICAVAQEYEAKKKAQVA